MAELRDLASLQRLFYDLVTAPEPVAQAMRRLGVPESVVSGAFRGNARLGARERLDVYAEMYFFRLLDVLAGFFPRTAGALGPDGFHNLVTDFLVDCPPEKPSIHQAGERLPAWIAGHSAARDRPWLCEVATLEWTELDMHGGPDAEPMTLRQVQAIPRDALGETRLALVPSHRVLSLTHRLDAWWSTPPDAHGPPDPGAETLLVWRKGVVVRHRPLDSTEAAALVQVAHGEPFGAVCEKLAEAVGDEQAAAGACRILRTWLDDELIAA